LQKDFEKEFPKDFAKNKTCGAGMVKNVKYEESIHAYPMRIYIGLIPSNLCT
jgi:hypothetical protein